MPKSKKPAKYIREVTEWATSCSTVLAIALAGSHARNEARIDSDIDLISICEDKSHLLNDLFWIERFGELKSCKLENWGAVTSVRVVYIDGQEIEFGISNKSWADIPVDEGTYQVVADGMIVLVDKKGILEKLKNAVLNAKVG